jgi:hypothetical protein
MSSLVTQQSNDFVKAPNRWRDAQRLMDASEVVVRVVQRNDEDYVWDQGLEDSSQPG